MLRLLSTLYTLVTEIRNLLFEYKILPRYESRMPVISVGNITAGGNAKTPITIALAQLLQKKGRRPVILTRGYGGNVSGPYLVQDSDSPRKVSDEALLLKRRCRVPVVVAKKRVHGAKFIEEEHLGNVILLDDGFQHRYLARDLDFVCISLSSVEAAKRFCEGEMLPYGRFREDRDRALRRATAVIFATQGSAHHALGDEQVYALIPKEKPIFQALLKVIGVKSLIDDSALTPCTVFAFCAIANPVPFFSTLIQRGYSLAGATEFPDHHNFTEAEFEGLVRDAGDLPLVCTEKDGVKIREYLATRGVKVYVLQTETVIESNEAIEQLLQLSAGK